MILLNDIIFLWLRFFETAPSICSHSTGQCKMGVLLNAYKEGGEKVMGFLYFLSNAVLSVALSLVANMIDRYGQRRKKERTPHRPK